MTQQEFDFDVKEQNKFDEWLALNPEIYDLFCRFALQAIGAGRKRLGAAMLRERIRWESVVREKHSGFKISNWVTPFLSRKFMVDYPQHKGIFETRVSGADDYEI